MVWGELLGASVVLNCDSQCVRSVDILSVVTCLICHKPKFGTVLAYHKA